VPTTVDGWTLLLSSDLSSNTIGEFSSGNQVGSLATYTTSDYRIGKTGAQLQTEGMTGIMVTTASGYSFEHTRGTFSPSGFDNTCTSCNCGGNSIGDTFYWHGGRGGCYGSTHFGLKKESDVHSRCSNSGDTSNGQAWGHFHESGVNSGKYWFGNSCIQHNEWHDRYYFWYRSASYQLPPSPAPTPAPPPEYMWVSATGGCRVDGSCVESPNYPSDYSANQACTLEINVYAAMPIIVESFSTESWFDYLTVNGHRYSGSDWWWWKAGPIGVTPTTHIHWSSDFSWQRRGWRMCANRPSGSRSILPRSSVPRQGDEVAAPTPAPPPKQHVVRVGMSLTSDGSAGDVESLVAAVVASNHGVSEEQVSVAATGTPLGNVSQQWHVECSLTSENESIAAMHLQIAQDLAANTEDIIQQLAQSFADAGLILDTTGFTIDAPDRVSGDHSCYEMDLGLKDLFEDGCDTYQRNVDFCGKYDDVDFNSQSMCCACGGGNAREPDWTAITEEPILSPEPGCVDTDFSHKDSTGDGCQVYGMDPEHFCGEFDDDDFSSMGMCCACHPYAAPTPSPPVSPAPTSEAGPTPSPGSVLNGVAPHGLSAVCALVTGFACALGGLVN